MQDFLKIHQKCLIKANVVGATVTITFLGDADLFASVTFPRSAHLLIDILRRWTCTVSLMDLTYSLNIIYYLLKMCTL